MPDNNNQAQRSYKQIFKDALDEAHKDNVSIRYIMTIAGSVILYQFLEVFSSYYDCNDQFFNGLKCEEPNNGTTSLAKWYGHANSATLNEAAVYGFPTIAVEVLWVPLVLVAPFLLTLPIRFIQQCCSRQAQNDRAGEQLNNQDGELPQFPTSRLQKFHMKMLKLGRQISSFRRKCEAFRDYLAEYDPMVTNLATVLALTSLLVSMPLFKRHLNEILVSIDCEPNDWTQIPFYQRSNSCSPANYLKAFSGAFAFNWMIAMMTYAGTKLAMNTGAIAGYGCPTVFQRLQDSVSSASHNCLTVCKIDRARFAKRRERAVETMKWVGLASLQLTPFFLWFIGNGINSAQQIWRWGFCNDNIWKMLTLSPRFHNMTTQAIPHMSVPLPEDWQSFFQKQFNTTLNAPPCALKEVELGFVSATVHQEVIPLFFWLAPLMGVSLVGAGLYGCLKRPPKADEQLYEINNPYNLQVADTKRVNARYQQDYLNPTGSIVKYGLPATISVMLILVSFEWVDQIMKESHCDSPFNMVSGRCGVEPLIQTLAVLGSIDWSIGSAMTMAAIALFSLYTTLKVTNNYYSGHSPQHRNLLDNQGNNYVYQPLPQGGSNSSSNSNNEEKHGPPNSDVENQISNEEEGQANDQTTRLISSGREEEPNPSDQNTTSRRDVFVQNIRGLFSSLGANSYNTTSDASPTDDSYIEMSGRSARYQPNN